MIAQLKALLVLCVFVGCASGARLSAEARPVRIGILTDLSYTAAYIGAQARRGALKAQTDLAAEGIQTQLFFEDHQSNNAKAATAAQKLLDLDRVEGLLSFFSGPSAAAAPIAKRGNIPFIYSAGAVSPLKDNPLAFKTQIDFKAAFAAMAKHFKESGISRLGFLKTQTEFGELALSGALAVDPTVKIEEHLMNEAVDAQVLRLKQAGVQAVMNAAFEGDLRNILQAMRRIKLKALLGGFRDSLTPQVIAEFNLACDRYTTIGLPQAAPEFLKSVGVDPKKSEAAVDYIGIAYLHTVQLARALTSCPTGVFACIIKELEHAPADPRFGFLGWDAEHKAQFNMQFSECQK